MKLIAACLASSLVSIILLPRLLKGITSLIPSSIRYLNLNLHIIARIKIYIDI